MEKITPKTRFKSIDEYIALFTKNVQDILEKLRRVIRESAPQAEEMIDYGISTLKLNGNLVHFAAFNNHIGFYPTLRRLSLSKKNFSPIRKQKDLFNSP